LINEILEALNSKKLVGGMFCDLEKALDIVMTYYCTTMLNFPSPGVINIAVVEATAY
jgi:hypothetical protein